MMVKRQICTIFIVVAVISLLSGSRARANDVYIRAGVGTSLTDRLTLDLAYRYTDSGSVETDEGSARVVNRAGDVLVPLNVGQTRAYLSSHGVWVSLRYAFYTL